MNIDRSTTTENRHYNIVHPLLLLVISTFILKALIACHRIDGAFVYTHTPSVIRHPLDSKSTVTELTFELTDKGDSNITLVQLANYSSLSIWLSASSF